MTVEAPVGAIVYRIDAIERCDMAAFEPLVERHLYGGIRRLGSKLTEEYADYFEPEP